MFKTGLRLQTTSPASPPAIAFISTFLLHAVLYIFQTLKQLSFPVSRGFSPSAPLASRPGDARHGTAVLGVQDITQHLCPHSLAPTGASKSVFRHCQMSPAAKSPQVEIHCTQRPTSNIRKSLTISGLSCWDMEIDRSHVSVMLTVKLQPMFTGSSHLLNTGL